MTGIAWELRLELYLQGSDGLAWIHPRDQGACIWSEAHGYLVQVSKQETEKQMAPRQNGASKCKLFSLLNETWKRRKSYKIHVPQRERTWKKGGQSRPEEWANVCSQMKIRKHGEWGKGRSPSSLRDPAALASSFLADPQFSCFPFSPNHPTGKATYLSSVQHYLHFWKSKFVDFPLWGNLGISEENFLNLPFLPSSLPKCDEKQI